jgi:ferredoxin
MPASNGRAPRSTRWPSWPRFPRRRSPPRRRCSSTLQLEAALQSRATPCFVYDPAGGTSWADRFTLGSNPQPDRAWPVHSITVDGEGDPQTLDQAFTLAHAAALDPAWRTHYRVLEPQAWRDDQVELSDYLDLTDRERSRSVPFIWVVEHGVLARAVITWELAFACRDRARAWRILQELAGTDNAYARRAAEEARSAVLEEADRRVETVEADFAVALESARGQGAAVAIDRLVQILADPGAFEAAVTGEGGALPAVLPSIAGGSAPAAAAAAEVAAPEPPAVAAVAGEPYIDSFLCTTCNDCINLNAQLFRYNADKQAEITDPSAGTFKQLVKAAEVCPARCIHPGAPRPGDKTATPALIERAAKFN